MRNAVRAALAALAALAVACGDGGRTVRAYHESGALRSETRTVPGPDGSPLRSGPFRSWYEDGAPASEGAYLDDARSGRWSAWYPDGTLRERGGYLFGEKEGVWVHRRPDGSLDEEATGVYEAGVRVEGFAVDGVVEDAYAEGRPQERATYVDGLRHGPCTTWHPNGAKRSEGTYVRGRRSGRWTYWDEEGVVDPLLSGRYDGWRRVAE